MAKKPASKIKPFPFKVGDQVFIRTVTLYYTGQIAALDAFWITLTDAAWVADTGRFHDFLTKGQCNEFEGFPESVSIPLGSIIDVSPWRHALFKGQK